jgi:hypothetical protein
MKHPYIEHKHNQVIPLRKIAFAALFGVCLLISACTVTLIGDYDDTIDKGVSDVQQRAELYFATLTSNPNTPYDQSFHDGMKSRLVVLKSRADLLRKYAIIAEQVVNLQQQFDLFQQLDKATPRPFPPGAMKAAQSALSVSTESILSLELALKRTGSSDSTGTTPKTKTK